MYTGYSFKDVDDGFQILYNFFFSFYVPALYLFLLAYVMLMLV